LSSTKARVRAGALPTGSSQSIAPPLLDEALVDAVLADAVLADAVLDTLAEVSAVDDASPEDASVLAVCVVALAVVCPLVDATLPLDPTPLDPTPLAVVIEVVELALPPTFSPMLPSQPPRWMLTKIEPEIAQSASRWCLMAIA
jgi:hypothetical protein